MKKLSNKQRKNIISSIVCDLETVDYPPEYLSDYLFYMKKKREFALNCYAYAMQFKFDAHDLVYLHETYPYNPGVIGGIKNYKLPKDYYTLMEYFLRDCRALGIDVDFSTLAEKTCDDEYKIAILLGTEINPITGVPNYHFVRQNSDLTWSDIQCFQGNVCHARVNKSGYKTLEIVKVKRLTREGD